jgi:hypothetical protein
MPTLSGHEEYVHGFHLPVGLEFLILASNRHSIGLRLTGPLPYTPLHEDHVSPLCLLPVWSKNSSTLAASKILKFFNADEYREGARDRLLVIDL